MSNKLEQYDVFRGYANGTVSDEEFIKILKKFVVRMRADRHTLFTNKELYMFNKPLLEVVMTFFRGKFIGMDFFNENRQKFVDFIELASAIEEMDTAYEKVKVYSTDNGTCGYSYFMSEGKVHVVIRRGLSICYAKPAIFDDSRYRSFLVQRDRFTHFHDLYIYDMAENVCYMSEVTDRLYETVNKTVQIQVFGSEREFKRYMLFS